MELIGPVDDQLVFLQYAGVVLPVDGKAALIDIQQLAEVMPVLQTVEGVGKFKILQVGNPGNVHLYHRRLESKVHNAPPLYISPNINNPTLA